MKIYGLWFVGGLVCLPLAVVQAAVEATLAGSPWTLELPRLRYTTSGGQTLAGWASLRHQPSTDGRIIFKAVNFGVFNPDPGAQPGEATLSAQFALHIPVLRYYNPAGTSVVLWANLLPTTSADGSAWFVVRNYAPLDQSVTPLENFRNGVITWYNADGRGNCSFDATPNDLDVAALTMADGLYNTAAWCGACAEVQGPQGKVVVRIVDSCPSCGSNHLDLSAQAFAKVVPPGTQRVNVTWRFVSCPVSGALQYYFKEGSSQYWSALQVRNHRLPIRKLEWLKNSTWVTVPRQDYNYFVEPQGMGSAPVRVRATALGGAIVEDTLPGVQPQRVLSGAGQFPVP